MDVDELQVKDVDKVDVEVVVEGAGVHAAVPDYFEDVVGGEEGEEGVEGDGAVCEGGDVEDEALGIGLERLGRVGGGGGGA